MDRRQQYRIGIGAKIGLLAKVCSKANIEIAVELVDLTYGGVGIVVPRSIQRTIQVGQMISLKFESTSISWAISAWGRIQNILDQDSICRVGIQFIDSSAVDKQLIPALRPLFNRRKAYRTQTQILGDTVCKWCPIDRKLADSTLEGHVVDVSGTGLSMITSLEHEALLTKEKRYRTHVAVNQSGIKLDFTLISHLLHFEKHENEIRVGFAFEEDTSVFFKDQQTCLFHFVAEVQRRILKESSDTEKF